MVNYIGDGIRAEFGYPLASENEAESGRSRRPGVAARHRAARASAAIATIQEPLRVRIGVHTGVAVIGKAGLGHVHDATEIVGDTPNIAFRLQEIGEPNSLVISGETRAAADGQIPAATARDAHTQRTVAARLRPSRSSARRAEDDIAHRDATAMPRPWSAGPPKSTSCCKQWELAKTGRGHTVEITGEPGIGKSRLALELIDKTGLREESIVALQASAQHQNTPLYPDHP